MLVAGIFALAFAIIGRQLTKQRWHTLYSHRQPGDKLVLAVECPEEWEEMTEPSRMQSSSNTLLIRPKPPGRFLNWWQQYILKQKMHNHTIILTLMRSPAQVSIAASKTTLIDIEKSYMSGLMSGITGRKVSVTTERSKHPLGDELTVRARSFPLSGKSITVNTFIFPEGLLTNHQTIIDIVSEDLSQFDPAGEILRKEIIRRIKVIKR